MARYRLSRAADRKLAEIYEYTLLTFGEDRADRYFGSLHNTFALLAEHPDAGRPFHEYRRHEHERHVIFYKPEASGALILQVLHQSEDLAGKLD